LKAAGAHAWGDVKAAGAEAVRDVEAAANYLTSEEDLPGFGLSSPFGGLNVNWKKKRSEDLGDGWTVTCDAECKKSLLVA
jgi:hypothetical protein